LLRICLAERTSTPVRTGSNVVEAHIDRQRKPPMNWKSVVRDFIPPLIMRALRTGVVT